MEEYSTPRTNLLETSESSVYDSYDYTGYADVPAENFQCKSLGMMNDSSEIITSQCCDNGSSSENGTEDWELTIDMQFNDGHVISIIAYSILIVVSALGNITVLSTILR